MPISRAKCKVAVRKVVRTKAKKKPSVEQQLKKPPEQEKEKGF